MQGYISFSELEARAVASGTNLCLTKILKAAWENKTQLYAEIPDPGAFGLAAFYSEDAQQKFELPQGAAIRIVSQHDIEALHTHGKMSLACRLVELTNEQGVATEARGGPASPTITINDLRFSPALLQKVG